MRTPQMSGWCAFPQTDHPEESHERCARGGAGNKARPTKEFQPCACPCHYADLEQFECDGCGGVLVETLIENDDPTDLDEEGNLYPVYLHLDPNGRAYGQECA